MVEVIYRTGPERVVLGEAGEFVRGVARGVPEEVAERLLAKRLLRFDLADDLEGEDAVEADGQPPGDDNDYDDDGKE